MGMRRPPSKQIKLLDRAYHFYHGGEVHTVGFMFLES